LVADGRKFDVVLAGALEDSVGMLLLSRIGLIEGPVVAPSLDGEAWSELPATDGA
jgi:hypothetical protein